MCRLESPVKQLSYYLLSTTEEIDLGDSAMCGRSHSKEREGTEVGLGLHPVLFPPQGTTSIVFMGGVGK